MGIWINIIPSTPLGKWESSLGQLLEMKGAWVFKQKRSVHVKNSAPGSGKAGKYSSSGTRCTYIYAYNQFAGKLNHSLHYFYVKLLCYILCSIFLKVVFDRTRITLGKHSAGKAENIPLFQILIMQIAFL